MKRRDFLKISVVSAMSPMALVDKTKHACGTGIDVMTLPNGIIMKWGKKPYKGILEFPNRMVSLQSDSKNFLAIGY